MSEEATVAACAFKCMACQDMGWVIGLKGELKPCPQCSEVINLNDYSSYTGHAAASGR